MKVRHIYNYFILDAKDISRVIDYGTSHELYEKYGFKDIDEFVICGDLGQEKNGFVIVQDDKTELSYFERTKDKSNVSDVMKDKLFYRVGDVEYYATYDCEFYYINKKTKIVRWINTLLLGSGDYKRDGIIIKLGSKKRRTFFCDSLMMKLFVNNDYNPYIHTIIHNDGNINNCTPTNLSLFDRKANKINSKKESKVKKVTTTKKVKSKENGVHNLKRKKRRNVLIQFDDGRDDEFFPTISSVCKAHRICHHTVENLINKDIFYRNMRFVEVN